MYQAMQMNLVNSSRNQSYSKNKVEKADSEGKESFHDMMSQVQNQTEAKEPVQSEGDQASQKPALGVKDTKEARTEAVESGVPTAQGFTAAQINQLAQLLVSGDSGQLARKTAEGVPLPVSDDLTVPQEMGNAAADAVSDSAAASLKIQHTAAASNEEGHVLSTLDMTKQTALVQKHSDTTSQVPVQEKPQTSAEGQIQKSITGETLSSAAQPAEDTEQPDIPGVQKSDNQLESDGNKLVASANVQDPSILKASSEGETVVVKLGDTTPLDGKQVEKSLGDTVLLKMADNQNEFDIQLAPENLGKLHIKISMEEGNVKVMISCEESKTMSLLSEHAKGIGNLISQNLNEHKEVHVEVREEDTYWNQDKQQEGQQRQDQRQQQSSQKQEPDTDDFLNQLRLGLVS